MIEDPIEILVKLAEEGRIDPWNIDIVLVTDRFLEELDRLKELDLRVSGRTLFFASTLLRMKSECLVEPVYESDVDGGFFEDDDGGPVEEDGPGGERLFGPIEQLEREIRRRLERKNFRKRPITLYELIALLRNAEKEERRRQRVNGIPFENLVVADDVVSIAHEEGYQGWAHEVLEALSGAEGKCEMVSLSDLAEQMGWSIQQTYIPLLFLMFEGKIEFWQEEFFGDLFLRRCDTPSLTGAMTQE